MEILAPVFVLNYEGKNITSQISKFVLSVEYTDNLKGQADEAQIKLEDSHALWKSDWYPIKGDTMRLQMGYKGFPLLDCGSFQVDEVEFDGPPDTVNIKGISTPIKKALKTKITKAHENKTLVEIAKEIGKKHGFSVVGSEGNIKVGYTMQKNESDLRFLSRIAELYGYVFKITDNKLVFYNLEKIDAQGSVVKVRRKDIKSYNIKDTTKDTYSGVEVSYYTPKKKKLVTHTYKSKKATSKDDVLKIKKRCENPEQAHQIAKAAQKQHQSFLREGSFSFIGNPVFVAGANIEVTEMKKLNDKYTIQSAHHAITKTGGYTTDCEVKNV